MSDYTVGRIQFANGHGFKHMHTQIDTLLSDLRRIDSSESGCTHWHRNPEGPQAAQEIERLTAQVAELTRERDEARAALQQIKKHQQLIAGSYSARSAIMQIIENHERKAAGVDK